MTTLRWERHPRTDQLPHAHAWLEIQCNLGLTQNTVDAYARAIEDFLGFCERLHVEAESATREHIARYVRDLLDRPNPRGANVRSFDSGGGLANATLQQRLVAVRLFYDYLVGEGVRAGNPVGRGRYADGRGFGADRARGVLPRYHRLPWIPTDDQWQAILATVATEPTRNRFMFALAYDAALRREELCSLETGDIDPSQRLLHVRAENTKNRRERVVPYSESTGLLYAAYLHDRRALSRERGALFRSSSDRNRAEPISKWTWSKVVRGVAVHSDIGQFSTHTLRHLRLTDLARAGWDVHALATFAGHRSIQSTLAYVHLSGRDLAEKFERSMADIHSWRVRQLAGLLA